MQLHFVLEYILLPFKIQIKSYKVKKIAKTFLAKTEVPLTYFIQIKHELKITL